MKINHKEALNLLRISDSKWRKAKDKYKLFSQEGFKLISTEKVGRSIYYEIEEPQEEWEDLKRIFLEYYSLNLKASNLDKFIELLLWYREEGTILNINRITTTLGISRGTVYNWRSQMQSRGFLEMYSKDVVVLYYEGSKRELGTEKDWFEWNKFKEENKGLSYRSKMTRYKEEKGFFPYLTSSVKFNHAFEELLNLAELAKGKSL